MARLLLFVNRTTFDEYVVIDTEDVDPQDWVRPDFVLKASVGNLDDMKALRAFPTDRELQPV